MQKRVLLYVHISSLEISPLFYLKILKVPFQIMVKTEFLQLSLLLAGPKYLQPEQCHLIGSVIRNDGVKNSDYNRRLLKHIFEILQKYMIMWPFAWVSPRALKGPRSLIFLELKVSPPLSGISYISTSSRKPFLNALSERIFPSLTALITWYCICGFVYSSVSSCQLPEGRDPCLLEPNTGCKK